MGSKIKKKLLKKLKRIGVVRKEKIKLKHAGKSSFYIDIKKSYGHPEVLDLITRYIGKKVKRGVSCVAGAGYGGIPLAASLALKLGLKLTLVREKKKRHGRNVWVDGYLPSKSDKVLVADDVLTTGKSVGKVVKLLKSTGAKVGDCWVVVNRQDNKVKTHCKFIFTIKDLI